MTADGRNAHRIAVWAALFALVVALVGCGGGAPEKAPATETPAATPPSPESPRGSAATAPGGSATVTGVIRFEGKVPALKPLRMDADPGCQAKHAEAPKSELLVLGPDNAMANILVRVKSGLPDGDYPVPAEPAVLDQQGCRYEPHVLGVMAGQTLKVLNSDGLMHNVHALPKVNKPFNLAMPANRTEAEHTFTKVEDTFKIKCDVHPWMGAWVRVLEHPFFSVTGADGRFTISGLPAGSYEIEAWHERMGERSTSVTVADGQVATADFTFTM